MRSMFRLFLLLVALTGAAVAPAPAQSTGIDIEARLEDTTFLPGEELPVAVRITNLSGQPQTFGTAPDWLSFYVESKDGEIVARLGSVAVLGEFTLQSAQAGTKWWNIQPHFDLERPGTYLVYAELKLPHWNQRQISEPVSFTIQPARKLWEVSFGVPPRDGQSSAIPEVRRYSLQAATRQKERKLFARVTDEAETRIFRVVMLDRLLSFSRPQHQLDHLSRLHLLFQTSGSTYSYFVLDPDGNLVIRQWHDILPASRPHLAKLQDGSIEVRGGARRATPSDLPPGEPAAPPPAAPATLTAPPAGEPASPSATSSSRRRRSP